MKLHQSLVTNIVVVKDYELGLTSNDLRAMVCEVNSTQLREDEILSNNVYYYDVAINQVTLA